jgi:hypothetical protein
VRFTSRSLSKRRNWRQARLLTCAVENLESRRLFSTTLLYVDGVAHGANNGTSWANAFTNLQTALGAAQADVTAFPSTPVVIDVGQGIYLPTNGSDADASFQLINNVSIVGGFAGDGAPDPGLRNVGAYQTILSGDIGVSGDLGDNSYHVVTGSGTNSTAVLSGVVVELGLANGNTGDNFDGGGMVNIDGSPTVSECTFQNNYGYYGAAVANEGDSSGTFTDCTFANNHADRQGGAINDIINSSPTIDGCTFVDNYALSGGAIYNYNSTPVIFDSGFYGNTANYGGGAIDDIYCGSAAITNCTFEGDGAENGGAIYSVQSYVAVNGCTFGNDTATQDGGAIGGVDDYYFSVSNCTFSGDTAADGGAVYCRDMRADISNSNFSYDTSYYQPAYYRSGKGGAISTDICAVDVSNCEFFGDDASDGAAIFNSYSSGTITGCDFTAGQAEGYGGAIANYQCNYYLTISQCTFAGDIAQDSGGAIDNQFSIPAIADCKFYNNVSDYQGGAIANDNSSASILSCTFNDNLASASGGAVSNYHCYDVTIDGCTFNGDEAQKGGAIANLASFASIQGCSFTDNFTAGEGGGIMQGGGAIYDHFYSSPAITDCTFTDNHASEGGAIANYTYCRPAIDRCTFTGNYASAYGGAIANDKCYAYETITGCTFDGDEAQNGGAISNQSASPTIENCVFVRDTAVFAGGAIYNTDSYRIAIANCTFDGDSAGGGGAVADVYSNGQIVGCAFVGDHANYYGGAISNFYSSPNIINCTFVDNTAGFNGGAISDGFDSSDPSIYNCILWGDGPNEIFGTYGSVAYNDIDGGFPGAGNIDEAPFFLRDADPANGDYGDLQVSFHSPTVNAGNNYDIHSTGVTTDLAGNARIVGGRVDMGAYEFGPQQPPQFTSADDATFTVGVYSEFFVTTDGDPLAQVGEVGALPEGISFFNYDNGSAVIYGTAAAGTNGEYEETFNASNGDGPVVIQNFTLTVEPLLEITSAASATFEIGSTTGFNITTLALPPAGTTLTVDGGLPDGVNFFDNGDGTGQFVGDPADGTQGAYQVTIIADDGTQQVQQVFTLNIDQAPAITSNDQVVFAIGENNDFTITTSGFPDASLLETGNLPQGVGFQNDGDGTATLSGMPAAGTEGTYLLQINADNGAAPDGQQFLTLTIVSGVYWTGNGDATNWYDPANWSVERVPDAADNVTIGSGFPNIQVSGGSFSVDSLTSSSPLLITPSGELSLFSPSTTTGSLTIQMGGKLDINNASLAIDYGVGNPSPESTIVPYLALGYAGGSWSGTGIVSSTAAANAGADSVGYADGSVDTGTPATPGEFLIQYTRAGDANLDGVTNFNDLDTIGKHLNKSGNDWADGNFNYAVNGAVNFNDLNIIGQNLNKQVSPAAAGGPIVMVGDTSSESAGGTSTSLEQAAQQAAGNNLADQNGSTPQQPATDDPADDILQTGGGDSPLLS